MRTLSLDACLKRQRIDLGWTQRQVAKFIGATVETYRNYEWNSSEPVVRLRQKIVKFLKKNWWEDESGTLANRCFCYRCEEGMTIKEMSMLAGVDESVIARIERNLDVKRKSRSRVEEFLDMDTWTLPLSQF